MNWQEFIDALFCSGCRSELDVCRNKHRDCQALTRIQAAEVRKLGDDLSQCRKLSCRPEPPEVDFVIEKDTVWIQACLEDLDADLVRLPLDGKYRLTDRDTFVKILSWDWINTRKYVREWYDCENFAISFKAHIDEFFGLNQVGIVIDYKAGHAYNLIVFPNGEVVLLEPQSDNMFFWAGSDVGYVLKGAIVLI